MREAPYIVLILVVIAAAALFMGNSDPISVATGEAEANAILSDVPAGGWLAGLFVSTLFKIVLSGVVLGIATLFISEFKKYLRDRQFNKRIVWKSGTNTYWQKQEKTSEQPKNPRMSPEQTLMLSMIEHLTPSSKKRASITPTQPPFVVSQQSQAEEQLDLRF
jgi:hypothetical protein